jgi:deoxyribonucleoside regulator
VRQHLQIRAAKLHHVLGLTQSSIAHEMGLTRWQVGTLLNEARDEGLVRIEIVPRLSRDTELEAALQRRWALLDAVVVPADLSGDAEITMRSVAHAAAMYLTALDPGVDQIGVSWGRTMKAVAGFLPVGWRPGVQIVMLNGSTTVRPEILRSTGVAEEIAQTAGGHATMLPVPAILGRSETRAAIESDPVIAAILEMADRAPVACFGLGGIERSIFPRSGYLDERQIRSLMKGGAVGDILGRFIDQSGAIVDHSLDDRTVGLGLDRLRNKDVSIGVTAGTQKQDVTIAAVRAGYVNTLITDSNIGRALLEAG